MKSNKKYALFTNDVETTSIVNNCLSDKTGEIVLKEGIPKLLALYEKYNIKSTFFFTGYIASLYPEIVSMILPYGHEVGCHGYSHKVEDGFDIMPYEKQLEHLKKAKDILEEIANEEVISFRAPALRVNKHTSEALIKTGFRIDSSTSAQRIDMFFSHGSKKKMNWLFQPRLPYFSRADNIWKKGDSQLLEIPISALGLPYIGTFMRISPFLNRALRYTLNAENKLNKKPIVFLLHPNELITESTFNNPDMHQDESNTGNMFAQYLKNKLRHRLKLTNLGNKAVNLTEKELLYFDKRNYNFCTLREFYSDYTQSLK